MDKRSSLIASDRLLFFFVYVNVNKYPTIKQTKIALNLLLSRKQEQYNFGAWRRNKTFVRYWFLKLPCIYYSSQTKIWNLGPFLLASHDWFYKCNSVMRLSLLIYRSFLLTCCKFLTQRYFIFFQKRRSIASVAWR